MADDVVVDIAAAVDEIPGPIAAEFLALAGSLLVLQRRDVTD